MKMKFKTAAMRREKTVAIAAPNKPNDGIGPKPKIRIGLRKMLTPTETARLRVGVRLLPCALRMASEMNQANMKIRPMKMGVEY